MEIEEELYREVLEKRGVKLTPGQGQKFRYACMKVVPEDPQASHSDLLTACHIYLNFILNNPDLDLGPVKLPK